MISEPAIDRAALAATLQRVYGIETERFVYEPNGMVSISYEVHGTERYFLKLFPDNRLGREFAARLDHYLPLCAWLRAAGVIERLPCAIPTLDGALQTTFGDYVLSVFDFIEGQVPEDESLSDALYAQLGGLVGRLHARGAEYSGSELLVEDFGTPFAEELGQALDEIPTLDAQARPGQRELRQIVEPHIDALRRLMRRLDDLGAELRATNAERVVCHTDLHTGNMIVDERGLLHLLDWEGAILAPAEHDLFFFAGNDRFAELFLPAYEREHGPLRLSRTALDFYYHRRNLEDTADVIARILYEEHDSEKDRFDLGVLKDGCAGGWWWLEHRGVAEVEEQLQAAGLDLFGD